MNKKAMKFTWCSLRVKKEYERAVSEYSSDRHEERIYGLSYAGKGHRIPHICYDEIWVPSSAEDNLYGYAEVYAIVCELKYRKLIWVSGSGKQVVRLHSVWQGIRDRYGICIFKIVRAATNIETKLKGYKW